MCSVNSTWKFESKVVFLRRLFSSSSFALNYLVPLCMVLETSPLVPPITVEREIKYKSDVWQSFDI